MISQIFKNIIMKDDVNLSSFIRVTKISLKYTNTKKVLQ